MRLYTKEKQGNLRKITVLGKTFTYTKTPKMPPHINREVLDKKIAVFDKIGINTDKRAQKLIVSLTSFPPRMNDIHYTLYSLLNQSVKPDEVVLWLANEQFPNGEADVPQKVLDLQKNGLTIKWCEDTRSYKKLIPAMQEYPDDVIVITDDDVFYNKNWLKRLYRQHLLSPKTVIGHRCHKIVVDKQGYPLTYRKWKRNSLQTTPSYKNFLTGCGGILYPPHSLYKDCPKKELYQSLAPYADDIWFWAMTVLNNVKIKTFWGHFNKVLLVNPEREMRNTEDLTLAKINIEQNGNDKQMRQVIEYYPQLREKLKNE